MDRTTPRGTPSPSSAPPDPGPVARLDRLTRLTRLHRAWMVLLGILFACDVADTNALAYALPAIRAEWGLSITQVGTLTSFSFLGMFIGAILGGRLADRFGRKRAVVWATAFYAIASVLCALAPNVAILGALRVLTGIGIQAVTGALIVYVAEMFPAATRGRYQALMLAIGLLGVPFIAFAPRLIVPLDPGAWRWLFVVAAIGALPALIAHFVLPESVRWTAVRGRESEAVVVVARLEHQSGPDLPPVRRLASAPPTLHRPADLFRGSTRRRTVVASLAMIFGILGFYGFNSWVPTLLVERGYSTETALTITSIFSVAPVLGALAGMLLTDRWQRRTLSLVLAVVVAAGMVVFALTGTYWVLVVSGFAVTFLLQTNTAVVYAYLPEVFPTDLRGLGSGFANGLGRLAGFGGAFLIAALFAAVGFGGVFTATALFVLIAGLILGRYGERTRGRRLDDIAPEGDHT